jgi:hypothetical protein
VLYDRLKRILTQRSSEGVTMNRLKNISKKRFVFDLVLAILLCNILFLTSYVEGKPNPKGKAVGNPHVQVPEVIKPVNPAGIIPASSGKRVQAPIAVQGKGVNQPGVLGNKGSLKANMPASKITAVPSRPILSNGYTVKNTGNNVFISQAGSNIVVKLHANSGLGKINVPDKSSNLLASGDAFAQALEMPDPIGAKGPNPVHGGAPSQEGGNPGGGNGKGNWGEGNQGNGFGNNWTGNQGRGRGAGMARPSDGNGGGGGGGGEDPPGGGGGGGEDPPGGGEDPPGDDGGNEAPPRSVDGVEGLAAPLPEEKYPESEGCPALIQSAAAELGTTEEAIQIAMGSALATNPNIQPCEACKGMLDAAATLRSGDSGLRSEALVSVFNELAPSEIPLTEESLTAIASTLAERASNPEENPQYALTMEYIDAFVAYVDVVENELGGPVEDTAAFAMERYGSPISEASAENTNVATYISIRLEGLGS